ncbi:MAG TPA: hypothetical protein V6D20_05335 [Candidatus Obscuribacterales bacterium]
MAGHCLSPNRYPRLRYDHLIESRWAHSYRYYIRPYSRYELLWQGLLQSPVLFPEVRPDVEAVTAELIPNPQIGGLDVVLDRTQPVDAPLILSSARLDAPSTPGAPAQPGSIWEVLLAQHPEQLLSERNQTLARQLDFRGVAVTLMRRFAYDDWPNKLVKASLNHPKLIVQDVEAVYPELPGAYPSQPDHLDLTSPLDAEAARSLDLPQRIGNFQQGAMALQWEALPYFYEHRLMAIAQTSTQVSEINNTIQQDFEYQSPIPEALVKAVTVAWQPEGSGEAIQVRSRQITIPLRRFWDCMPSEAQKRWASEAPLPKTTPGETDATDLVRKPASLPDFDVVYQIIERFSGNIEVQADYVFDDGDAPRYIHRQLGRRFLANVQHLQPPSLSGPHGDYLLETMLQQVSETDLLRDSFTELRSPTVHKITYADHHLTVVGTLTQEDFHNLLLAMIRDNLSAADLRDRDLTPAQVIDAWFSTHPVDAHSLAGLPTSLLAKVHYPDLPYRPELASGLDLPVELQGQLFLRSDLPGRSPNHQRLQVIWRGALSTVQREQLLAYHKNLNGFHQRLRSIIQKVEQFTASASYSVPVRPHPDSNLLNPFVIRVTYPPADRPGWVLQWSNNISPQDRMALRRLPGDTPFRSAINRLIERIHETYSLSSSVTSTDVSPALDPEPTAPSDLPLTIAVAQTGQDFARYQLTWTGPIRSDQAQRLRTELPDLLDAVNELITQIQDAMEGEGVTEDRETQSLLFREAIADDEFVWPRVNKTQLESQMQADLSALMIESNQITWKGLVNPSPENLVIRLRRLLRQADPFLAAFTQLMDDISAAVFTEDLGKQRFRVRELLTAVERDRLVDRMGDQPGLRNLFHDWDDRQSLDELYQAGFSQVPISAKPERVNRLAGPIDFPEVENLVLVRTDRLTETEAIALLNLPGDLDFKAALRQLIRPQQFDDLPELRIDSDQGTLTWVGARPTAAQQELLRELEGDAAFQQALGRLVNAIAATADTNLDLSVPMEPEPSYATAIAPQGLDQVPQAIAAQVSIAVNNQRVQTDLIWTGPLTDAAITTLEDWAQISAMMIAVQALISERDRQRIVVSLPSDRLPASLRNVLHIHPGELVWTGGIPSDDQRAALSQLQTDSDHNPPLQTALDRLLSTPDARFPVVAIAAPQLQPRPRLDQRPDILRADDLVRRFMPNSPPSNISETQVATLLAHQLVIQHNSLVWLGRVHHLDQLQALQNLPGDPAFREAIAQLHAQLSTKVSTIAFLGPRLPQRPQQDELPAGLRDKLLLGRAQLRYHGLMTLDEGRQLRSQFTTQPDQASIQRLYDQSMDTGLRGNELLIRARRGNARPSEMYTLKPRSL